MLTLPNFERLKVFHIVYLNRSIQKAADQLFVTRSAISQSLKHLEEEIGFKLFIRDSKHFQPTIEAEILFSTMDPFVLELNETFKKIEVKSNNPVGQLRIGAPLDFGSGLLTIIMGKFKKHFPEITFELTLTVPIKQLELLCEGKLDLAFIDNGDIHAGKFPVSVQNLMKEEFVLVSSPSLYKKYGLDNSHFNNLITSPMVDYLPHAPVLRLWFKHHFSRDVNKLNLVYSAESVRGLLNAVSADLGIGVVPRHLLSGEFKHLKIINTTKGHFVNHMMIARQLGKRMTTKEKEFINFSKVQLKTLK